MKIHSYTNKREFEKENQAENIWNAYTIQPTIVLTIVKWLANGNKIVLG